ncbi:hypothetical protein LZZ85_11485 [Terrimonas sp. NA20]|uniref:Uncharacterized protein n=1 Tax=Terrimonas ginsenosidimutans TaxID=2908004 RepID=A0ABS9KRG4_9BACT|nr:hypothetical protein [Terrimonas ginsenosidimutans]MCG2614911.1 hypothetical protein [Terrimonas ginsenosidimutans]
MGIYVGDPVNYPANIYQFDETDVVQGGPNGIDNKPLKELADRTEWLRANMGIFDRLKDEALITGNAGIDANNAGKLNVAYANGIVNLTLDNASNFDHGAIIPITSHCTNGSVININTPQPITDPVDGDLSVIHMHHKEHLVLVALTNYFRVMYASPSMYTAGEEVKAREVLRNTLVYDGSLFDRARHPRLAKWVLEKLTFGEELVSEAMWFSDPTRYRGCFTVGNGSTTLRLPDERGMGDRMLDLGRGIDISRFHPYAGGYEADALQTHYHYVLAKAGVNHNDFPVSRGSDPKSTNTLAEWWNKTSGGGKESYSLDGTNVSANAGKSSGVIVNGTERVSTETIMKNIGKLNLVKF